MAKPRFSWAVLRLNCVFFGGLLLWTALFLPFATVACIWQVAARDVAAHTAVRNLIRCYGRVCCAVLSSQIRLEAIDRASPLPRPCIIAANHQSFFDPYCVALFPVYAPTFVVRAWPFRIPLYGKLMRRAGYLNIEEMSQEDFLRKAGEVLQEGAALVVFPEGTRSATGEIGRFRSGAFKLAVEWNVPVVPMCIQGANRVFPRGARFGKPSPMTVTLLPPIHPSRFREYGKISHRYLQKSVKLAIRNELELQTSLQFPNP